jgi:hypothetical protein
MAYIAATMPLRNHSTIYDYGTSASLWVSAFEILAHPGPTKKVKASTVIDLLGEYDWIDKEIDNRECQIFFKKKMNNVNLVQKLYKELYDTRNDYLHGNPTKMSRLFPFKTSNKETAPITQFAPLIFKIALLCFLNKVVPAEKMDPLKEYMSKKINEAPLAKAILRAKRGVGNG